MPTLLAGMMNIKYRRCLHSNCLRAAAFNYPGERALLCSLHQKEGELYVHLQMALKSLRLMGQAHCNRAQQFIRASFVFKHIHA